MAELPFKDKIPPHNEEAEQAALGAILLDDEAITKVSQDLRPEDFYSNANRRIYEAILSLFNHGLKADIITVVEELKQTGNLDHAGGPAYVASLTNLVPTSANIEFYAGVVMDCSLRRSLLRVSAEINARAYDEREETRELLEKAQQRIFDLSENRLVLSYKSAKDIIPGTIAAIEKLYHSKDAFTGVPSGLEDLDHLTNGFQKSELIILGARPSVGKTALALTMAANMAIRGRIPVAFFTLEMSDMALMQRIVSSEARIESEKIRTGFLRPSDFKNLLDAAGRIYDAPLYIVDMPNMPMLDIRTQSRRLKLQQKIEIIFVDYIGLINIETNQYKRNEQFSEISRSLKSLARELNIPIVALSQLNREAEGVKPSLANIRESGSIEQDADLVMFLHRDRDTDKNSAEGMTTHLIIAKQRNGPVGTVEIVFIPRYTKFESLTRRA